METLDFLIRPYLPEDLPALLRLFVDTVHTVNAADYSLSQLDAWAPLNLAGSTPPYETVSRWAEALARNTTLVAVSEKRLAGFADLDNTGYFDHLYVGGEFQRRGIASALAERLEQTARELGCGKITTEASVTALPFFQSRGYRIVWEQQKPLRGEIFRNFVMEKNL